MKKKKKIRNIALATNWNKISFNLTTKTIKNKYQ